MTSQCFATVCKTDNRKTHPSSLEYPSEMQMLELTKTTKYSDTFPVTVHCLEFLVMPFRKQPTYASFLNGKSLLTALLSQFADQVLRENIRIFFKLFQAKIWIPFTNTIKSLFRSIYPSCAHILERTISYSTKLQIDFTFWPSAKSLWKDRKYCF